MSQYHKLIICTLLAILCFSFCSTPKRSETAIKEWKNILSYRVDVNKQHLQMYYKSEDGKRYGNFQQLKNTLEANGKQLKFAMNGGMYLKNRTPQGLYIENGITIKPVDTSKVGYGNFFLQPNGVFCLMQNHQAIICPSDQLPNRKEILYATQSGPMLLIDGSYHPAFNQGSSNVHIRNGVGMLPNGDLLFAISKEKINFYDFATFFKEQGCKNALYLDGFVSRAYLPAKNWKQLDGDFGVIIAEWEHLAR